MIDEQMTDFVGKKVKITFTDNEVIIGTLAKGDTYYNFNWNGKGYHIDEKRLGFKKSHVKKIEVLKGE